MSLVRIFLILFGILSHIVGGHVVTNDTVSACASKCKAVAITLSPCATTDASCLCEDSGILEDMQSCLAANCTVLERLQYLKAEETACEKPVATQQLKILSSAGFGAIALGSVLIRLLVRWKLLGGFGADDWVIALAGVLCFIFTILGCVAVNQGFGLNLWDIPIDQISMAFKVFYAAEPLYIVLLALTKISIILFMLRIFPTKGFRIMAYTVMAFIIVVGVVLTLTTIFQCVPISYNWESWRHGHARSRCLSAHVQSYVSSVAGILQDIMILALPVPSLLRLKVALRRKLDLFLMFGMGTLITIVSCIRFQFLLLFAKSDNPTWDNSNAMYWSGIEVFASFLITSLPAIRTLLSTKFPSIFGTIQKPYSPSARSNTTHTLQSIANAANGLEQTHGIMKIEVVIDGESEG